MRLREKGVGVLGVYARDQAVGGACTGESDQVVVVGVR
jgi:hypothetical protein